MKSLILTLLSALLLVLPFIWGELSALAFIAFIPFLFVLERKQSFQAFKYAYLWGLLFYIIESQPLIHVSWVAYVLAILYLALYPALFGLMASSFLKSPANESMVLFLPAFWAILEAIRGWLMGGAPWAFLAYSQWKNLIFIQIADWIGVYGVSFLVVFVNIAIFQILKRNKNFPRVIGWLALVFFITTGYGYWTLRAWENYSGGTLPKTQIRVAVVQGNIPQDQKWNTRIKNIIFEKYKRLTLMSSLDKPDLIVWPETSFPGYLEDEPMLAVKLRVLVRQSATQVLVGAPTLGSFENGLRFYNSAILLGSDGEEKIRYNKIHLVPFGEFVPIEPLFGMIRNFVGIGNFSPGKEKVIFNVKTRYESPNVEAKFAVLICSEDMFPGLVRSFCRKGVDFLVNITNDAWFGNTSAPYQHAQASIFRAIENRVNVVRAANTGLSCFISPVGKITTTVQDKGQENFVSGHATQTLILAKKTSFYSRFGDIFLMVAFFLCFMIWRRRSKYS